MTTEELLRPIETDAAWHRLPGHDPRDHDVYGSPCVVTIGSLSGRAGVPRRTIEEAIETARRTGTPVITNGGIRVARTAEEADALADWLDARMDSQRRTRDAVRARALAMATEEAEQSAAAARDAQPVQQSMELVAA